MVTPKKIHIIFCWWLKLFVERLLFLFFFWGGVVCFFSLILLRYMQRTVLKLYSPENKHNNGKSIHMYIYIYVYIDMYMYIQICTYIYIFVYLFIYLFIHFNIHIHNIFSLFFRADGCPFHGSWPKKDISYRTRELPGDLVLWRRRPSRDSRHAPEGWLER